MKITLVGMGSGLPGSLTAQGLGRPCKRQG